VLGLLETWTLFTAVHSQICILIYIYIYINCYKQQAFSLNFLFIYISWNNFHLILWNCNLLELQCDLLNFIHRKLEFKSFLYYEAYRFRTALSGVLFLHSHITFSIGYPFDRSVMIIRLFSHASNSLMTDKDLKAFFKSLFAFLCQIS